MGDLAYSWGLCGLGHIGEVQAAIDDVNDDWGMTRLKWASLENHHNVPEVLLTL